MRHHALRPCFLFGLLLAGACGQGEPSTGHDRKGVQEQQVDGSRMRFSAEDLLVIQGQAEAFESNWITPWYGKPAWSEEAPAILGDTRSAILLTTPARFRVRVPASSRPRRLLTAVRRARPEDSGVIRAAVFWQSGNEVRELAAIELPNAADAWATLQGVVPEEAGELVFTHLMAAPGLADKPAGHISWQEPQLLPLDPVSGTGPDVLLLTIDTLRTDALEDMPFLQELMYRGTYWNQAYVPSNWTLPSMASLFTGASPAVHGCGRGPFAEAATGKADSRDFRGLGPLPTMAEAFRAHGYATAMFHQNPFLENWTGMQRGFERYVRTADRVAAQSLPSLEWWADYRGRPRFLSLHYMAPHLPNGKVEALEELFPEDFFQLDVTPERRRSFFDLPEDARQAVRQAYREEVRHLDSELARLIPELLEGSRDWRVLVYIDHGEEHWDAGGFEHGFSFDDSVVRVPLAYIGGEDAVPRVIEEVVPAHHGGTFLLEQLEIEFGLPLSALGTSADAERTVETRFPLYRSETGGRRWDPAARSWVDLPFTGEGSPGAAAEIDPWTAARLAEIGYAEDQ